MRILIVPPMSMPIPAKGYGGTQRVCCNLADGLSQLGHTVYLPSVKGSDLSFSNYEKLKIIELPIKPRRTKLRDKHLTRFYESIREKIDPNEIDVIQGNTEKIDLIKALYPNTPIVALHHGLGKSISSNGQNIFVSHAQRKYYAAEGAVIYNSIHLKDYIYQEEKKDYLLFLAAVGWKVKGVEDAIEVAKQTGKKLVIAGPGMNLKVRLAMKRNMKYVGVVGGLKKAKLLAEAKAILYPTKWCEPFGLVPAEAAASGTPSIVYGNGAMPEVVKDGVSGYITQSLEEMVAKVKEIDKIKPSNCRKWVEDNFDHLEIAKKWEKLFKEITLQ